MEDFILIIEDDILVAENTAYILNQAGYNSIHIADNLTDVIKFQKKNKIALIISDINLHGVNNGPNIIKELQNNIQIPVIYLTAYSEEQIVNDALSTNPIAFVLKPFTDRQLLVAVQIAFKQIEEYHKPGAIDKPTPREIQVIELIAKGLSNKEAKKQLDYWFEKLDIKGWWNKKIEELSKGMAQKIQFVVCVLHQPKLLIFDEPFSGFDPVNANIIKDEILELKQKGATIIFSTHRMESVEELCDDIALIHKSNKLIEGKLEDVKRQFRTNSYEIGILTQNVEGLMYDLTQKFIVSPANFKSLNNDLKLEIQIGTASPNDLLAILTQRGQVTHFLEKIPSVNDIFIKTITEN